MTKLSKKIAKGQKNLIYMFNMNRNIYTDSNYLSINDDAESRKDLSQCVYQHIK